MRRIDSDDFRNRFLACTLFVYFIGFIFILTFGMIYADKQSLYEFRSDLFAEISGENTKYQRADAEKIANVLKGITKERFNEDLGYMTMLSMGNSSDARINVKDAIIIQHPQELEDIVLYYDMIENWSGDDGNDFQDTLKNATTRMALKKALLTGGEVPQSEPPKPLFPAYSLAWNILILIAITQFIAFGLYCIVCWTEDEYPLNLPEGIGSKIAMMFILPGSLPLMVPILIGRKIDPLFKRPHHSRSTETKLSSFHENSTKRSKEVLEKLSSRIGD